MIKDDERIEFVFEKVVKEPTEDTEGESVELFVEFNKNGNFGPTVRFTEELEPSKRSESEWTILPLDFFVEVTSYLISKGQIKEKDLPFLSDLKIKENHNQETLAKPILSSKSVSLNLPKLTNSFSPRKELDQVIFNQSTPVITHNNGGIEIQNSHPPYQHPLNNTNMQATSQLNYNPFNNRVASAPVYQIPSHFSSPIENFSPTEYLSNQEEVHSINNSKTMSSDNSEQIDANDLTSILNSEVTETPPHLQGQAAHMLEQRAMALSKKLQNPDDKKIKPAGKTQAGTVDQ